jgi:hypothetical protein
MRVILCSRYLEQQQERAELAAEEALRRPIRRPDGFWARLGWWLAGREVAARLARIGEAHKREGDALRYAQGRDGEELLARVLARHLDDRYTLLRNYTPLEDRRGDIDAVLAGPHGVTSFEVKAWRGYFRVTGDQWYFRESPSAGWRPADQNPTQQALANVRRLRAVLVRGGLGDMPVRPVVAIAGRRMVVELAPPLGAFVFFATQPQRDLEQQLGAPVLDAMGVRTLLDTLLSQRARAALDRYPSRAAMSRRQRAPANRTRSTLA